PPSARGCRPSPIPSPRPPGAPSPPAPADVAGTFAYTPASGAVLTAGAQSLTVQFTPTDSGNYNNASTNVSLTVLKGTPVITWSSPSSITYPTALSSAQLNATADVPGAFTYTPTNGTVLDAGPHTLTATFSPTDSSNYN